MRNKAGLMNIEGIFDGALDGGNVAYCRFIFNA